MIDLNHGSGCVLPSLAERINAAIDAALIAERHEQPTRTYLGASRLGDPCARRIQYDFDGVPRDPGCGPDGRSQRIFERGHRFETMAIRWLRKAGFDLRTTKRDGGQFGFIAAEGRIAGHIDGVIVSAPTSVGLAVPALWEHKALKSKSWQDTVRRGVAVSKPIYAGQIALYQAYLDLTDAPALFTATNADTCELYHEAVPFDAALAQGLSDKAVNILRASAAGETVPRMTANPDHFECRFCDWQERCWRAVS